MKKKWLLILITLIWTLSACCASAEAPMADASAGDIYRVVWTDGPAYGCGIAEIPVMEITNDPARGAVSAEAIAAEIRFFPFDAETGLYGTGEGEPAGDRAKILEVLDNPVRYVVKVTQPGKYTIAGNAYYLLDPDVPALDSLRRELDGAVEKCTKGKEAQTARALHDWLCGRVKSVIPAEDAARLSAACSDPVNALLTGYANRDAYAPLYRLLLGAAGIRSLIVSGTTGEEAASWTMMRTDGSWVFADAALDDAGDKKNSKYAAMSEKQLSQDHVLCAADRLFVDRMIRPAAVDALLDSTLTGSMLKTYKAWDRNLNLAKSDGPFVVVGDSMTVTLRLLSSETETLKKTSPEQFLEEKLTYAPWIAEEHFYCMDVVLYEDFRDPNTDTPEEQIRKVHIPPRSELYTIDSVSEDLSTMTLTFREPGKYTFMDYFSATFYLISPEQEELVSLAGEMEKVVAAAKAAGSEKAAAQTLMRWIRNKVKYNYPVYRNQKITFRDYMTSGEALGALLYGKCICGGYAAIYDLLMHMAGLEEFIAACNIVPSYEGHVYNLNRLDGVWSYTDVTWNRFDWTPEKMDKDHEPLHSFLVPGLFFGSPFDLLADQFSEDCQALRALPPALKYLPASADADFYGFKEHEKDLIDVTDLAEADGGVSFSLSKAAQVHIIQTKDGEIIPGVSDDSGKPVKQFSTAKVSWDKPLQIQVGKMESTRPLARPFVYEELNYEGGKLTSASCKAYAFLKGFKGAHNKVSYQFWIYGADRRPLSVCWYIVYDFESIHLQVWFDEEGKAERYAAEYDPYLIDGRKKTSWEATADGVLTKFGGKAVDDPDSVRLSQWEPVIFR